MDYSCETFLFEDDGVFPNNNELAVVIYQQVFVAEPAVDPKVIEQLFNENQWSGMWRNGLYREHHYHSTAHEALGIYSGWIKAQLGGPFGRMVVAGAGDVIVIPAGVSHMNVDQSSDFRVLGAYPAGQIPDLKFGRKGERPGSDENIRKVALPQQDPVFGISGPISEIWR